MIRRAEFLVGAFMALFPLWSPASCAARRSRRGTSDKRRRRAPCPASSCSRSSGYMRDRPSEAASRPAASGARSSRAVSAPRTIDASLCSGSSRRAPTRRASYRRCSARRDGSRSAPSMSKGAAEKRSATASNFRRRDEQKHGGRIDEATDQPGTGDAIDLRARARDPYRAPLGVARRQFCRWNERPASPRAQPTCPPISTSAESAPACRSQAATPSPRSSPFWSMTTTARPANSPAHSATEA